MLSDRIRASFVACVLTACTGILLLPTPTFAEEETGVDEPRWPREIQVPEARIVVYQPQLESFKGNKLNARAAVSVTPTGKTEPIFGAVWFAATVRTDRDLRLVTLVNLDVADVKFPNAKQESIEKLSAVLKAELSKRVEPVSLDRILTALKTAEGKEAIAANLGTDPPKIIFMTEAAVLVTLDGEPVLRPVENSKVLRVVNTPFLILQDPESKKYYLHGGDGWYEAKDVQGPWQSDAEPPKDVASLLSKIPSTQPSEQRDPASIGKPRIVVATEPTELIVSKGTPQYKSIKDTNLAYMTNTDDDVFLDKSSLDYFVLLAGRWYTAKELKGPWSYVAPNQLPEDFAKIPEDSEKGSVLAHVAGTEQAEDAVHEAYIPQTAAIDRKKATLTVEYDGPPQFKPIEGTQLQYAVNTSSDVIQVGDKYYCCSEGVWFVSASPTGPWVVCDSVPPEIYSIPPQSPVYPVTYVEVYESTPETVYVGYTPGYVGCYPYCDTIVYGTGWYYPGWIGGVYWPRPPTWGFGVRYNPITGNWGFRVGYSGPNGWVAFGYRNGIFYDGAWAAGGWHGSWGGWWGHGGFHDFDFDGDFNVKRGSVGDRVDHRVSLGDRNNIYNRAGNVDRLHERPREPGRPAPLPADQHAAGRGDRLGDVAAGAAAVGGAAALGSALKNDVYADRNGNVYRRTDQGWEQRKDNGWAKSTISPLDKSSTPAQRLSEVRPSTPNAQRPAPSVRPATPQVQRLPATPSVRPSPTVRPPTPQYDLNRNYQARQRGDYRTNNYQSYRNTGASYRAPSGGSYRAPGAGGGGFRGGGGGRGGGRR